MGKLFDVYLSNSLQLAVIVLLMLAFSPLMTRRYSAKCRYYLWVIIFVALILPVRTKIALTLPEVFQPILPQSINASVSSTATITNTVKAWYWHQYAGLLWAAGVLCFLGWHLFQHLRFLSAVRRWSEDIQNCDVLEQFRLTKRELKIRNRIAIKSCACIKTPMVIGLFHPVVLLPQINFLGDELPLIFKHELVHYKRKDLWYKVLMLIASAIHWFNLMVHLMVRSVLSLREISCDEEVLQGNDTKGRAQYGEAIIGVVRNRSAYHTILSTNFYSGTQGMKKRIYAIMDMSKKRFSPVLFIAILVITIFGTTALALSPLQAEGISQNLYKETIAATDKSKPDSEDSTVQPSSASDVKLNNQEKQLNDLASTSNDPRLVSGDLQLSENTPAAKVQPQNSDTNRLVPGDGQP